MLLRAKVSAFSAAQLDSPAQRANVALLPTRTIAYLSVSTEKQADRGISLDAQRAKVQAYAQLYDLDLVESIVDAGESAKSLDRPGLKRALDALRAGTAEALLVVKLDRLTRSVVDLGTLVDRYFAPGKAALLSVGEQIDTRSAAGRLVLNVLASVSQWEREAIGERTATAMQHKASQGEYTGGQAPYGRRVAANGERLEEDAREAEARTVARELRAQGLSLRGVAAELERRGMRSRTGRGFAPVQVKRMLGRASGGSIWTCRAPAPGYLDAPPSLPLFERRRRFVKPIQDRMCFDPSEFKSKPGFRRCRHINTPQSVLTDAQAAARQPSNKCTVESLSITLLFSVEALA